MPVSIEAIGGLAVGGQHAASAISSDKTIRIALINNMPDAALEDTEHQFLELLSHAASGLSVHLKLIALPTVPRADRGAQRLGQLYHGIDELWNYPYDAVIVTGTEPKQADLTQEPYWMDFAKLLDWAQENTVSTILSCLAAHAGVLHSDGIARMRLPDKMFGVYDFANTDTHSLMRNAGDILRFPHSRWNGLPPEALTACGYQLITQNTLAGADCFVKQKGKSLTVHFQGHPEYQSRTLFKEYRRDIRRFLEGERETYPTAPFAYFSYEAAESLKRFQWKAMSTRTPEMMREFPEALATANLQNGWHSCAVALYRNWLEFIAEKKAAMPCYAPMKLCRSRDLYAAWTQAR